MPRARNASQVGEAPGRAHPAAGHCASAADAIDGRPPDPELGDRIRQAELAFILGVDPRASAPAPPDRWPAPWGIALSGGGIRSATFSLGVLQALAENRLLRSFHYQSSISGGGYTGGFLQGLIRRKGVEEAFAVLASHVGDDDRQKPILHLREYSNYLSPRKELLSGDTLGMIGTYVRNVVLIQIQLFSLMMALSLFPLLLHPFLLMLGRGYGTVACLVAAGLCAVVAASLLELISRHAGAPPPPRGMRMPNPLGGPQGEQPGKKVLGQALAIVYLVAAAVTLGALGLWPPRDPPAQPMPERVVSHTPVLPTPTLPYLSLLPLLPAPKTTAQAYPAFTPGPSTTTHADSLLAPAAPTTTQAVLHRINRHHLVAISGCYFIVWALWLIKAFLARNGAAPSLPGQRQGQSRHPLRRFFLATLVAALLAGPLLAGLGAFACAWFQGNALRIIIFGPSFVLAAVMLTGIMHVGLAGPALTDLQREMWARVAGKAAATVLGLGAMLAMVIYGPWLMLRTLGYAAGLHAAAWLSTAVWILTTGAGVLAAHSQRVSGSKTRPSPLELVARIAPSVFLVGLLIAVSLTTQLMLRGGADVGCPATTCAADTYMNHLASLAQNARLRIAGAFIVMLGIWAGFGFAIDLNEFSMNAFYRNRLVRCYLGACRCSRAPEPTTNFDPDDDMPLSEVVQEHRGEDNTRPLYPLIGATLNLVDTKQLDWQDRKAAPFVFTPGYCGYVPPPSHPRATAIGDSCVPGLSCIANAAACDDASLLANTIRLGSAMAISGAAVSPNMGYHSSPVVTLLLTLFDARLGWWLPNPNRSEVKRAPQITFYGEWLVREMLGRTREEGDFVYLSDGGHFENLGIYELVRRRCEFILCVDSTADPDRCFADLGNAIQKCRTDFGCEIDIDVSDLRCGPDGISRRHCAVGRIHYPRCKADPAGPNDVDAQKAGPETLEQRKNEPEKIGILLYLKPSMTGIEPADVAYYARTHQDFPHESTADQYFDEAQFESYRRLGRAIASSAVEQVVERAKAESDATSAGSEDFGLGQSDLKASFLRELQYQWIAPLKGVDKHFSQHARAMASLFTKLRREHSLAALDGHLYPAWSDIAPGAPRPKPNELTVLPAEEDFRACFYFCQELVQLMESVYHDLDLEHACDHPDNRGWMNAFRQWSWSPVFRIAWTAGSPTYGKPFVTFCELRLGLPAMEKQKYTAMDDHQVTSRWDDCCQSLLDARKINPLEWSLLAADPLQPMVRDGNYDRHILLLRLNWDLITVRNPAEPDGDACPRRAATVGVAVLVDGTLHLLRIQDHVRQMGLGATFMQRIVRSNLSFERVDVRPGRYGEIACYTPEQATRQTRKLDAMRRHAQSASSR